MAFRKSLFGPPDVEKMKNAGDVPGLIKALRYRKDRDVRREAAYALGEIGAVEAVMPLIGIINESLHEKVGGKFMELSWAAAEALGEIGDVRAVEPLIKYLEHEKLSLPEYKMKAATALGKIGDPRAILPIKSTIDWGSKNLREWVDNKPPGYDDFFNNAMQEALDKLMTQPELDEPQVVDKITASASKSFEEVIDDSQNLVGLWLPDTVDVEDKVRMILSMALLPLPGSYRVVSNSEDERGGCFVMFEATQAPGETEAQYQQSLAAEGWFKKGVFASQQGDFQQAVMCFDKATAGQPFSPESWNNKAIALASLNRNEEAIQCCDKAIELKPGYADAWDIKGRTLGRIGKFHEALPVIEKFIELAPPDATDRVNQAKRAVTSLRRRL
jgi:tetratricopeptide (TPR) repeat protein